MQAKLLIICIAVATILNGANFWLKKSGLLSSDTYNQILQQREQAANKVLQNYQRLLAEDPVQAEAYQQRMRMALNMEYSDRFQQYFRSSPGWLMLNKLLKYLVIAGILLYSAVVLIQTGQRPVFRPILTVLLLFLAASAVFAWIDLGYLSVLAGISVFSFSLIPLARTALIQPQNYSFLIKTLFLTLIVFYLLAPAEIIRHAQLFHTPWHEYRLSGFMNFPNTMGIYLVCSYSLISNYYLTHNTVTPTQHILFSASVLAGIMLTGSFTALAAFMVYVTMIHYRQLAEKRPAAIFFFSGLLMAAAVYLLKSERSVLLSLSGRLSKLSDYMAYDFQLFKLLFGHGIGYSSNLLINLTNHFQLEKSPVLLAADSTLLTLLMQIGLLGLILVYGLIIQAAYKDRALRGVYITFLISSLTINLLEVFPLNIILGLLLCISLNTRYTKHPLI